MVSSFFAGWNNYMMDFGASPRWPLTSQIWLIHEDAQGDWQATAVADIGDPTKVPLPVDISLSSEDDWLWVDTFSDGRPGARG